MQSNDDYLCNADAQVAAKVCVWQHSPLYYQIIVLIVGTWYMAIYYTYSVTDNILIKIKI